MAVSTHRVKQAQGRHMAAELETRGLWGSEKLDLNSGFAFIGCLTLGE